MDPTGLHGPCKLAATRVNTSGQQAVLSSELQKLDQQAPRPRIDEQMESSDSTNNNAALSSKLFEITKKYKTNNTQDVVYQQHISRPTLLIRVRHLPEGQTATNAGDFTLRSRYKPDYTVNRTKPPELETLWIKIRGSGYQM